MKKSLKKLSKSIQKLYWKNDQRLYLNCYEDRESCLDTEVTIYACNKKGELIYYLFDILTIKMYWQEVSGITLGQDGTRFDPCFASIPYYYDNQNWRRFTLKKSNKITEDEIIKCTRYFCKEILDSWTIWNIELLSQDEVEVPKIEEKSLISKYNCIIKRAKK